MLAVCDAALPMGAPWTSARRREPRAVVRTTPPAPIAALFLRPSRWTETPPLWPPPVPGRRSTRCRARAVPATAEAFAEVARAARGEPLVLTDVPMGNATTAWTPERFATCAEADRLVNVHVCPPDASSSREARDADADAEIPGTPTVDLAGHRAPGTRRNFQFRAMPLAEFAARVVASGETRRDEERRKKGGSVRSYPPVVAEGETYYLRSVADAKKARRTSRIPWQRPTAPGRAAAAARRRERSSTDAQENTNLTNLETPYPRRAYAASCAWRVGTSRCGRLDRTTTCWRSPDADRHWQPIVAVHALRGLELRVAVAMSWTPIPDSTNSRGI